MKRVLVLVALSLFLCLTASAFQGGGDESTKKSPDVKKKSSGTKRDNTALSRSHSQTIEGTVIKLSGTKYVSEIEVESGGKKHLIVTWQIGGERTNPTLIGGDDYAIGTRVRVTYVGKATRIVRLDSRAVDTSSTPADENGFQNFFTEFSSAVRKRDRVALRLMMSSTIEFLGGDEQPSGAFDRLDGMNGEGWKQLEKSVATGTKPYRDSHPQIVTRVTNLKDNLVLFARGSDEKWRWLRFLSYSF